MRNAALAVAVSLASSGASADTVDIGAALAAKLNPRAAEIFQAKLGKPMPAGTNAAFVFQGSIAQTALEFTMPPAIPQRSAVLLQSLVANCDGSQPTQRVSIRQSTTQAESWVPTDTATSPVTVRAAFATPAKAGFDPATTGYAREWNQGGQSSLPLAWDAFQDVPVANGRKLNVQFVVDEQTIEAPFTATFVASGKAAVSFDKPAVGVQANVTWSPQSGNSVPAGQVEGTTRVGDGFDARVAKKFDVQYVCRTRIGAEWVPGVVSGDACLVSWGGRASAVKPFEWMSADWGSMRPICVRTFDWRNVCPSSVPDWNRGIEWVNGLAPGAIAAGSRAICRVSTGGENWVAGNYREGKCFTPSGTGEASNLKFQTMALRSFTPGEKSTAEINVEDYVSPADRTFTLRGKYTGVSAIQGDFRVATPRVSTCDPATVKSVVAGATSTPALATVKSVKPLEPLTHEDLKAVAALPKSDAVPQSMVKPRAQAPATRH